MVFRHEAVDLYSLNRVASCDAKVIKNKRFMSKAIGSKVWSYSEKAIAANVSAVREWDSNGTVFGYNHLRKEFRAGDIGHNDYYSVVIAACHNNPIYDGQDALKGMILLDEIRGRLAESYSLTTHKIDHVMHGSIAAATTYGAMLGASPEIIENAIGMVVSHYVPFRAIRSGS